MSKIDEVKELVEKGKAKLIGKAVEEALAEGSDPGERISRLMDSGTSGKPVSK